MENKIQELRQRIKRKIPFLTESQKVIADYIIENPKKFALSSIRELEKELKTSKSTIVRLAQTLDYNGFYELKSAFLQVIRTELDPIHRYKTFLRQSGDESDHLQVIAEETIHNINASLDLIDRVQYDKAIQLLEGADHVYTIGLGISYYLAEIAAYHINRISIKADNMASGGLTFAEQIINLTEKDVILAFSFPTYSWETIEAASYAKERGIKVISVTDKVTCDIVPYSEATIQVAVESRTISNSIMSVLVLIYSIVSQIGKDLIDRTLEGLNSLEYVRKEHSGRKTDE